MAEVGLLPPDVRTELLEGEIINMAPIGIRHAECVNRLNMLFAVRLADRVVVSVQHPVRLDDESEPQPDLMLIRKREPGEPLAHPVPADVLLLVEVSDTTVRFDRLRKMPIYSRFQIAEAWLVDLPGGTVERRLRSEGGGFGQVEILTSGHEIAPAFAPDVSIPVADLLPY